MDIPLKDLIESRVSSQLNPISLGVFVCIQDPVEFVSFFPFF